MMCDVQQHSSHALSQWYAPHMWRFSFGGRPVLFHGGIFPASPWGFCISAGREGGYVLHGSSRRNKLAKMVDACKAAVAEATVGTGLSGAPPE